MAGTLTFKDSLGGSVAAFENGSVPVSMAVQGTVVASLTSPNDTLTFGGGVGGSITADLNLANPNTWTGAQTFSGGIGGSFAVNPGGTVTAGVWAGSKIPNSELSGPSVTTIAAGTGIGVASGGGVGPATISNAGVVTVNGLTGAPVIAGGVGATITAGGGTITVAFTGTSGVASVNGVTGNPVIAGGTGATVTVSGSTITVTPTAVPNTALAGPLVNEIVAGSGITIAPSGGTGTATISVSNFVWKGALGVPFVTVSAVGTSTSTLITVMNNGCNYGPDTPLTATCGLQEAENTGLSYYVTAGTYNLGTSLVVINSNKQIFCDPGAVINVASGVTFPTKDGWNGSTDWTQMVVFANCSNVDWYGGMLQNRNTTNNSISGFVFAGNTSNITVYSDTVQGMTRWAHWITGYAAIGTITADGNVSNISIICPTVVNCGNTTTPDGGFLKTDLNATTGSISGIFVLNPQGTGLNCMGIDFENDESSPGLLSNVRIIGGNLTASSTVSAAGVGLFVEAQHGLQSVSDIVFRDVKVNGFTAGSYLYTDNQRVTYDNVTFNSPLNGTIGVFILPDNASTLSVQNHFQILNTKVLGFTTAYEVDMVPGSSGVGVNDVTFVNCVADDNGAGRMTAGLKLVNGTSKWINTLHAVNCNFSQVAAGGTVLVESGYNSSYATDVIFDDCTGIPSTFSGGVSQIVAGTGVSLSPVGGTGTVTVSVTGFLPVGGAVTSLNGLQGSLTAIGGTGATVTTAGSTVIVTPTAVPNSALAGPLVAEIVAGTGITLSPVGGTGTVTINASGTLSASWNVVGGRPFYTFSPSTTADGSDFIAGSDLMNSFASCVATLCSTVTVGATLYMKPGTYTLNGPLFVTGTSEQQPLLVIADPEANFVIASSPPGWGIQCGSGTRRPHLIFASASYVEWRGGKFTSSVARASQIGYLGGIHIAGAVDHLTIRDTHIGEAVNGLSNFAIHATGGYVNGSGLPTGISTINAPSTGYSNIFLYDNRYNYCGGTGTALTGDGGGEGWHNDNNWGSLNGTIAPPCGPVFSKNSVGVNMPWYGLDVASGTTMVGLVSSIYVDGMSITLNPTVAGTLAIALQLEAGPYFSGGSPPMCNNVSITNSYFSGGWKNSIGYNWETITIENTTFANANNTGLFVTCGTGLLQNVQLIGVRCLNNNQKLSGAGAFNAGLTIGAVNATDTGTCNGVTVIGGDFSDYQATPTQKYGICPYNGSTMSVPAVVENITILSGYTAIGNTSAAVYSGSKAPVYSSGATSPVAAGVGIAVSTVTGTLTVSASNVPWDVGIGKIGYSVSPAGTSTAGITVPNNGADFGPDTTLGSTVPGVTGTPYTATNGINEAGAAAQIAKMPSNVYIYGGPNTTITVTSQVVFKNGVSYIGDGVQLCAGGGLLNPFTTDTTAVYFRGRVQGLVLNGNNYTGTTVFTIVNAQRSVFESVVVEGANATLTAVSVSSSPTTYANLNAWPQVVNVYGGTVTGITLGTVALGDTAGAFWVPSLGSITVSWSGKPLIWASNGIGWFLTSGTNGATSPWAGNYNCGGNNFIECTAETCSVGWIQYGLTSSTHVTDNHIHELYVHAANILGMGFVYASDTNTYDRLEMSLSSSANGTVGVNGTGAVMVALNMLNPTVEEYIYANHIYLCSLDTSYPAQQIGFQVGYNSTDANVCDNFMGVGSLTAVVVPESNGSRFYCYDFHEGQKMAYWGTGNYYTWYTESVSGTTTAYYYTNLPAFAKLANVTGGTGLTGITMNIGTGAAIPLGGTTGTYLLPPGATLNFTGATGKPTVQTLLLGP
jgi:hypothetical protein